jgi:hypothetical protein
MSVPTQLYQLVDNLPTNNITVYVLRALDFVIPNYKWENLAGFDAMIRAITGEQDPQKVWQIRERANQIYNSEPDLGYRRSIWLYHTVDKAGTALGTAAMANKVGNKIGFLSFLKWMTPKADTSQAIDLSLKIVVELLSFCYLHNISVNNIGDFATALQRYRNESLMRMAGLICFDGLLPLGPDFLRFTGSTLEQLSPAALEKNAMFQQTSDLIPGGDAAGQLTFIQRSFASTQTWMDNFLMSYDLSTEKIVNNLHQFIEFSDDRLDYVSAFLDIATNYFAHTGTQTVARTVIERAAQDIRDGLVLEFAPPTYVSPEKTAAPATPSKVVGIGGLSAPLSSLDRMGDEVYTLRTLGLPAELKRDNEAYFVTVALQDQSGNSLDMYFICSQQFPQEPPNMFIELNNEEQSFIPPSLQNWSPTTSLASLAEEVLLKYQ